VCGLVCVDGSRVEVIEDSVGIVLSRFDEDLE
jgi:hypothetical protein